MTADEKNALTEAAKTTMRTATALVIAEVFSGLAQAPALLLAAAEMIRRTGDDPHADQAQQRAGECAAILAIPWPFIYAGSAAWISAVKQLEDALPQYIDLGVSSNAASARAKEEHSKRAAHARSRWDALSDAQRTVLLEAGLTPERLVSLGSV